MRIGVLTGGGDCPGLNAVIRAVTKSLIRQCGAEVIGIEDGFSGLMEAHPRTRALDWRTPVVIVGAGPQGAAIAAAMGPMARSFWSENRRTSNRRLTVELGYRLRPLRRGHFTFSRCEVHLPSPLGLWSARRFIEALQRRLRCRLLASFVGRQLSLAVRHHLRDQIVTHLECSHDLAWRRARGMELPTFFDQVHLGLGTRNRRRHCSHRKVFRHPGIVGTVHRHIDSLLADAPYNR